VGDVAVHRGENVIRPNLTDELRTTGFLGVVNRNANRLYYDLYQEDVYSRTTRMPTSRSFASA
jgi:hypothetical protein